MWQLRLTVLYINCCLVIIIPAVSKSRFMWLTVVRLSLPWWVARHLTRHIIPHSIDITVMFVVLESFNSNQLSLENHHKRHGEEIHLPPM